MSAMIRTVVSGNGVRAVARVLAGVAALCVSTSLVWAGNVCDTQASLVNPQARSVQAPGIGGTGMLAARPDIGGTGMLAVRPGIGGTGIDKGGMGGTGIVGVITGFASICVGGVEVHYNNDTPMSENGQPSQASDLAVGQVVVVNAAGVGDEVQARQVALLHVAIGPLQSVNLKTGEFKLLGQRVQASTPAQLAGLQAQQWVRVSGQRNAEGEIMASHVEVVAPQPQAQLLGMLSQNSQQFAVAGTPVAIQSSQMAHATRDTEVMAQGLWTGDHLVVTRLTRDPTRAVLGRSERVVLEGYVRRLDDKTMDIDHRVLSLSPQTQVTLAAQPDGSGTLGVNQRVRITGRMDADQRIFVERIESTGKNHRSTSKTLSEQTKRTEAGLATETKSESRDTEAGSSEKSSESSTKTSEASGSHEEAASSSKSSEVSTQTEKTSSAISPSRTSRANSSGQSGESAGTGRSSGSGESKNSGRSNSSGESRGAGSAGNSGKSGGGESKGK